MVKATIRLRDDLAATLTAYLRDNSEVEGVSQLVEQLLEEFRAPER